MPTARRCLALAAAVLASLVPAAGAAAGEYTVVQCDPLHRGFADARFDRTDGAYYDPSRHCDDPDRGRSLRLDSLVAAPSGAEGRIYWPAPDGTSVVGVSAEANLRRDAGHRARLSFLDARGEQAGRIATGVDEPGGFEPYETRLDGVGRAGFAALLLCVSSQSCPQSDQARTWIRSVRVTLRDAVAPTIAASGSLLGGGWLRGSHELALQLADRGSGLRRLDVSVGGSRIAPSQAFGCELLGSGGLVSSARPCPVSRAASAVHDTTADPFADGANPVRVCASDLGAPVNRTCLERTVRVDNESPRARFASVRDREDPELITATLADRHSGIGAASIAYRPIAGGEWTGADAELLPGGARARVDSTAVPPGRYEFVLAATDVAGNTTATTKRDDGRRMVLEFPLKERTAVRGRVLARGHRVPYGSRPRFRGRLRVRGGRGLAGMPVQVVQRFEPGSRPARRTRTVRTSRNGGFSVRLSKGPSRKVVARYAGDGRYLPSTARRRKLAVVGRARLRLSRKRVKAGGRARFRGRIGIRGARVPAPGKVVELQVREKGKRRYRTVRQALHTSARGRLRTSYRFGRFYRTPVRYQFRLKITRQAKWPYRAPSHSRPRTLTVLPR